MKQSVFVLIIGLIARAGALAPGMIVVGCDDNGEGGRIIFSERTLDTDSAAENGSDGTVVPDTSGDADADADSDADAGETAAEDTAEEICDEKNFEVTGKLVDILIVLDRSLSMEESRLWVPMGQALTDVTALTESNVNYGLMTFPFTDEECSPGDILLEIEPGNAAAIADVVGGGANDVGCALGTPTAETLRLAKTYLEGHADGLEKYVLLANDGAPNCNGELLSAQCRCSVSMGGFGQCPSEWCLDDEETEAAAQELFDAGFPVYVLGIGDSMQWADVMDRIAEAGGTGQYIPADSDQFAAVLMDIIGAIMSCEFDVDWDSLAGNALKEPDKVNFYCKQDAGEPSDPDPVSGNVIPLNPNCSAGPWGWTWTDDTFTTIRMCDEMCDQVKRGYCPVVTATFGCATIEVV